LLRAERLPPRPVLLAVCTLPPWPVNNGYALRVARLLRHLAPRWSILLLAPPGPAPLPPGIAEHVPLALQGPGVTYPWRFDPRGLCAALERLVRERRPDRALVWPGVEDAWAGIGGAPPGVLDMIDCNPLEFWRGTLAGGLRERWRNLSQVPVATLSARRAVRGFAATACVGAGDAAWLSRIGGGGRVHVVPNGVDLPSDSELAEEAARPTLGFVGSLDFAPNIDAVLHAAAEIWPRIRRAEPDARFLVAGRNPAPGVAALHGREGIEVAADVPDMVPVLGRCWVSIAPMRIGAGIKNKVLESWACARPVAMTPLATNGLVLPPGHRDLVGTTPAALADAVLGLFRDRRMRQHLGRAARDHVRHHAGWGAAAAGIDRLLRDAEEPYRTRN
jgi:glycosyltransferase involved in cell wall biosynthesis